MHLRPNEHLENRRQKCTHKKDSLHVFVFYNWSTKKTELTVFFQNRTETEPNLKNPFHTSLVNNTFKNNYDCNYLK